VNRVLIGAMVCVSLVAAAADGQVSLLTANGRTNPEHSAYKQAPVLALPNAGYYAVPDMNGEKGSATALIPFSKGILTNGDASTDHKRKPGPYTYWAGKKRGELVFELGVPCRIRRVRVCVHTAHSTGCGRITLYDRGNVLEFPEALLMGRIDEPKKDWNEFADLDRLTDGLRLVFGAAPGKRYLTVAEVEVWGTPMPEKETARPRAEPGKGHIDENGIRWYAFDCGTEKSPVVPLFARVSRNTAYTAQLGHGWLVPAGERGRHIEDSHFTPPSKVVPGLNDRDRGAGKRSMVVDDLNRDFVMTQGAYHTQTRLQFALDLANGRYRVMTFHSDIAFGRIGLQRFVIEAEGNRVVKDPYFPSIAGRCEFEVDVADKQLNLTFDGTNPDTYRRGWHLNGLLVVPINDERERAFAKKKLGQVVAYIDREKKRIFEATFVEKPHVDKNTMPPVSQAERARGFVAFVPNWMEMVYQNTVPTAESKARRLHVFACRGEREPYALAVRTVAPLKQLTLSVSALRGPAALPATAFDLRVVRCHPQRIGSSWSREWCVMPQILDPSRPVDLPADRTQEFWLTLRVPDDARPGMYTGQVTVACDRGSASLPLTLQVLPFDLAGPGKWIGMYWRPLRCDTRERMLKQMADMRAHGMNAVAATPPKPKMKLVDGRLVVDSAKTLEFLRLLKENGFTGPIACHWGVEGWAKSLFGPDRVKEGAKRIAAELVKISQRPDTPELLFYPVDEIGNAPKRQTDFMRKAALIRQAPGAKVYCTVNNFKAGQRCVDYIDYWCSNIVFTLEWERFVREHNKVYMRYGPHYTKDPRRARNSAGFGFFRRNAVSMYYWHYQAFVADPFDDLDGGSRDWCAAYPGPDGPIPTLDWEGVGEGVDDLRYINTLKTLAASCEKMGGPAAQAAKEALAELDKMLARDTTTSAYDFMSKVSDDEFHALRRQVVDLILGLHERKTVHR